MRQRFVRSRGCPIPIGVKDDPRSVGVVAAVGRERSTGSSRTDGGVAFLKARSRPSRLPQLSAWASRRGNEEGRTQVSPPPVRVPPVLSLVWHLNVPLRQSRRNRSGAARQAKGLFRAPARSSRLGPSGAFAREFIREMQTGARRFRALVAAGEKHPIEATGKRLRRDMRWTEPDENQPRLKPARRRKPVWPKISCRKWPIF